MARPSRPSRAAIKVAIAMFAPLTLGRRVHEIENRGRCPDLQPTLEFNEARIADAEPETKKT